MLFQLDPSRPDAPFPPVELAEEEPDGLLAIGGDLTPTRLLNAYRAGIFPWYSEGQPLLWWSPDPRLVLYPEQIRVSRSLGKTLRNKPFTHTFDHAFEKVIQACATIRRNDQGTWITNDMTRAYNELHRLGRAHSVEVWQEGELVGGLYGITIGRAFFGESMFSYQRDASKVALVRLAQQLFGWGFRLIDCQVYTSHLASLGAVEISRSRFCRELDQWCPQPGMEGSWAAACIQPLAHD